MGAHQYRDRAAGGKDTLLTNVDVPNDGPEYSPDGRFIYFNSEQGADKPGHAQLFRMDANGSGIAQPTSDPRVNWFPHISPDGTRIVYLSYPSDTRGHPADLDVILRVMPAGGGASRDLAAFFGGQGRSTSTVGRRTAGVSPMSPIRSSTDFHCPCAFLPG